MPELVGFQTMVILDPKGMTFDAVGAFGLAFQSFFKYETIVHWVPAFFMHNKLILARLNLEI